MTSQEIKWASEHDWFIAEHCGYVHAREIVVREEYTTAEGIHFPYAVIEKRRMFSSFQQLREWA